MYSDEILIEKYNSVQNDSINQLLSICFGDDGNSKMYFERGLKSPNILCTYVALQKSEVVGGITTWKTNFHPNCTYMAIIVHPLFRDIGMENQLLKIVESNQSTDSHSKLRFMKLIILQKSFMRKVVSKRLGELTCLYLK
ncbi:hypothetical protein [Bacillus suaedae]|uniref:Uncharacterized protein n=1 Tax=Halalkalibacter suaedae TaxID=2822140 RepID=A0A941APG9_9BACI|nr:hypothetical protein [Bacillus suaedae]MBP3951791.1 hypothetical protein [Bacillus suaedae]